jgi:hypothetical protein
LGNRSGLKWERTREGKGHAVMHAKRQNNRNTKIPEESKARE